MRQLRYLGFILAAMCGASVMAADDLAALSDDFSNAASLSQWQRLHRVEGWAYDPWQEPRVDAGTLTIVPRSSGSYQDYRPPLMYKEVTGDFVLTTQVTVTGRDGRGAPQQPWSLGGVMARRPRVDVPDGRTPDFENYLLLSLGATGRGGIYQVESKSTRNSRSTLAANEWGEDGRGTLRLVRVGAHFIMLARAAEGPWRVVQRHYRPDLPETLQVGLTAFTDWASVQRVGVETYNTQGVADAGNPDLRYTVHAVTLARPSLPSSMTRLDWLESDQVPDARVVTLFASDNPGVPSVLTTTAAAPMPPAETRPRLPDVAPAAPAAGNDLATLSDEFNDARTLANWQRLYRAEKMGGDTIQTLDINTTRRGHMTLIPYTVVWYMEYRGPLVFKEVNGDFAVTSHIMTQRRGGGGAPRRAFSLCGIMLRKGRAITAETWQPGGENYCFLSTGTSDQPGTYQLEVKSTANSVSHPEFMPGQESVTLRAVRVGSSIILLYKFPNGEWQVRRRFDRPDMQGPLQAGLTCYTDYPAADRIPMRQHNTTVLRDVGNPDLEAFADYVRYSRVTVPAALRGRALHDANAVSDAALIAAFGTPLD